MEGGAGDKRRARAESGSDKHARLCDTDQNVLLVRFTPHLVGRGGKGAEVHTAVTLSREGKGRARFVVNDTRG